MKVFITKNISEKAVHLLRKEKFQVNIYKKNKPISRLELIKNIKDADAVIALLTEKFDKELIDKISKCKVIANYAVGFNKILLLILRCL